MANEKKYTAFISYNSRDDRWAKWLQERLERYSLPSVLANEKGVRITSYKKPAEPFKVFRYVSDLVAKTLNEGLREELDRAQYLIVVCSPNSARSIWVGKEIRHFIDTGRKDRIIPFIVDGTPYSGDERECFNPALTASFESGDVLGVNVNDYGDDSRFVRKRKAIAKVVALLLGLPEAYGYIWNRYQHRLYMKIALRLLLVMAVAGALIAVWRMNQPFDARLQLTELTTKNDALPPLHDAIICMTLGDETKTDTVNGLEEGALIPQIPHRFLGEEVHVTFSAPDYLPLDTTLTLGHSQSLGIRRDEATYGTISFTLWDERREMPVPGIRISVGGIPVTSDAGGRVTLSIPLEQQRTLYPVKAERPLADTLLSVPHTESTIIALE